MYFWSYLTKISAAYLCLRAAIYEIFKLKSSNLLLCRAWLQIVAKSGLFSFLDCKKPSFGVEISANKAATTARVEFILHPHQQPAWYI